MTNQWTHLLRDEHATAQHKKKVATPPHSAHLTPQHATQGNAQRNNASGQPVPNEKTVGDGLLRFTEVPPGWRMEEGGGRVYRAAGRGKQPAAECNRSGAGYLLIHGGRGCPERLGA
eukprot:EG_transcript_26952